MNESYSVSKVAEILEVSRVTVYKKIEDGEIISFMQEGNKRVTKQELDKYLDRQVKSWQKKKSIIG